MKLTGAAGADSWKVREALELPEAILDLVAEVFQGIEAGGQCPVGLELGLVPLLPKSGDSAAKDCLLYTSPSPRDKRQSRMPSSA